MSMEEATFDLCGIDLETQQRAAMQPLGSITWYWYCTCINHAG